MGKITSMHFTGWRLGLKTGMYYLRTMAASAPIQFTVDQEQLKVEDTNIAKAGSGGKKSKRLGPSPGGLSNPYSAVPRKNSAAAAIVATEVGTAEKNGTDVKKEVEPVPEESAEKPAETNGVKVEEVVNGKKEDVKEEKVDGDGEKAEKTDGKSEADIFSEKAIACKFLP